MRILFVEDDDMLGKATLAGLRTAYAVDWMKNAEDAQEALLSADYDLLVLDINLPGQSGLEWLKKIRRKNNALPCLFLTARDATYHRIEGLNAGADDYVVKPFDLDELLARCAALIRRSHGRATQIIRHRDVIYDATDKSVTIDGKSIALSAKELAIFDYLINNIGRVVSKQQIEEHIYDWGHSEIGSNTVEVHMSALRKKIGRNFVKTIRNIGYVIEK